MFISLPEERAKAPCRHGDRQLLPKMFLICYTYIIPACVVPNETLLLVLLLPKIELEHDMYFEYFGFSEGEEALHLSRKKISD